MTDIIGRYFPTIPNFKVKIQVQKKNDNPERELAIFPCLFSIHVSIWCISIIDQPTATM